ncbi:MAG: single-stranded DNA-binding protein [Ruminococcaceae bacterium]|nr:single-stranded DNA-binding protein [Oscillospiraceae bacterium]MBQ2757246.1 single-stranded DNA-binding protein [Clostridia bacterium]
MSSLNLNKVVLCGRLTADPELKQTQSGIAVVTFTLAVNRRFQARTNDAQQQQQADFITLVAWRQTAEFISKFFKKGSALCVTGSIQTRSWQDNQGQRRYATEVVVDEAMFVDSRTEGGAQGGYTPDAYGAAPAFASPAATAPNFEELKTDDDLPF